MWMFWKFNHTISWISRMALPKDGLLGFLQRVAMKKLLNLAWRQPRTGPEKFAVKWGLASPLSTFFSRRCFEDVWVPPLERGTFVVISSARYIWKIDRTRPSLRDDDSKNWNRKSDSDRIRGIPAKKEWWLLLNLSRMALVRVTKQMLSWKFDLGEVCGDVTTTRRSPMLPQRTPVTEPLRFLSLG